MTISSVARQSIARIEQQRLPFPLVPQNQKAEATDHIAQQADTFLQSLDAGRKIAN